MIYKNLLKPAPAPSGNYSTGAPPPAPGGNYMTGQPVGTGQYLGKPPTQAPNPQGPVRDPKMMYAYRKMLMQKAGARQGSRAKQPPGYDKARGLGQAKAAVLGMQQQKRASTMPAINPVKAAMEFSVRDRSREQGGNNMSRTPGAYVGANDSNTVARVTNNPLRRIY